MSPSKVWLQSSSTHSLPVFTFQFTALASSADIYTMTLTPEGDLVFQLVNSTLSLFSEPSIASSLALWQGSIYSFFGSTAAGVAISVSPRRK